MFTIISIMFIGIGIGYLMRNVQMLQKVDNSLFLKSLVCNWCAVIRLI